MEEEIRKLLQAQRGQAEQRGWSCPDDVQLASYVALSLSSSEREAVEAHIADCDFCLKQVAFLTQSAAWHNGEEVPSDLLAQARKLVTSKPGRVINWGWRWAAASAAFACLIVLVVVVVQRSARDSVTRPSENLVAQQIPSETVVPPVLVPERTPLRAEPTQSNQAPKPKPTQPPDVRGTTAEQLLPKLISPRNGGIVRRDNLELRWTPVTEAIFYDVLITSAAGDVVFEKQTEDTALNLGSAAPLVPGTKYFATVRAHLRLGKTVKSSVVSFRLAEQ